MDSLDFRTIEIFISRLRRWRYGFSLWWCQLHLCTVGDIIRCFGNL